MLVNSIDRRAYHERGTKYGRERIPLGLITDHQEDVDNIQTVSNSTSDDHSAALKRDFRKKIAEVKLILVVLDVLLVLQRLTTLRYDVWCLRKCHSRRIVEATTAVVSSVKPELETSVKSAMELRFDAEKQNVRDLKTGSRHSDREQLVGSQSQRSSSIRDHRTCCRGETVDLNHCFVVVVVCAAVSVLALLPVAVVGGPSRAGIILSRVILPTLQGTVLPATEASSTGQRPHVSGHSLVGQCGQCVQCG